MGHILNIIQESPHIMLCKKQTWYKLLILGLGLVVLGYAVYRHSTDHINPVPYDQILDSYFQKDLNRRTDSYEIDAWALWHELGINPSALRESGTFDLGNLWWKLQRQGAKIFTPGRYLFNAHPHETTSVDCDFALGQWSKIISLSRDSSGTQILVFRSVVLDGVTSYRFSYSFAMGLDSFSDRACIRLVEPEPGLELLEVFYRAGYGTGTYESGWSLYRLDDTSAERLLKSQTEGWSVGPGPSGYGYRCERGALEKTWPKMEMTFFSEYVPWSPAGGKPQDVDFVDVFELNAQIVLSWDYKRGNFIPSPGYALDKNEIQSLIRDQMGFLLRIAEDVSDQKSPAYPITRIQVRRSECLLGWGL